jgi:hypothetical protein
MFMKTILSIVPALAHLHMNSPLPIFTNGPGNQNAPSAQCSVVQYQPDSPAAVLAKFKGGLQGRFSDLRQYFDACGNRRCGNTVPNHIVPVPSSNVVRLNIGARHVGPVEIWIDDQRVVQADSLQDSYSVDFSICKGRCTVRLLMAALHNFPAELYDNCVVINTGGAGGSPGRDQEVSVPAAPSPTAQPQTQITSTLASPPAPTDIPSPNPIPTTPSPGGQEWSCSTDSSKLLRSVGSVQYEFSCPPGTLCKPVAGIDYPVCQ